MDPSEELSDEKSQPECSSETGDHQPLLCVEYPGRVKNVERMIQTLGGIDALSKVAEDPSRRMELRFRPNDPFCKPACGDRNKSSTSFLMRVRKQQRRRPDGTLEYRMVHDILGYAESAFEFTSMADFQYLPVETEDGVAKPIRDKLVISKLEESSWLEEKDVPLFLPPAVFSRMDLPQDYHYRKETAGEKPDMETSFNIIGRTRQRRSHYAIFVSFDVEQVPSAPRSVAKTQLKLKFISNQDMDTIKSKFEECPIWSKTALHAETGIPSEKLKFIIPAFAYYFSNGPWRNQWVRFGYDPRKDREGAAMLQTLDFRVRYRAGAYHKVPAKRNYSNYILPYKASSANKTVPSIINPTDPSGDPSAVVQKEKKTESDSDTIKDTYVFRPGRMPPSRQMFYQLRDLEVPEAQDLLMKSFITEETTCSEKNGWFKPGTDNALREILTRCISENLAGDLNDSQAQDEDISSESSRSEEEEDE